MWRRLFWLSAVVAFLVISPGAYAQSTEPFLGQILIVSFSFAPKGWALCNGQILAINQNQALFAVLGTTYGGDGIRTFALPDLRGRVPIHVGQGPGLGSYVLGTIGGEESVTLTVDQIPAHTHHVMGQSSLGTLASPVNNVWATQSRLNVYSSAVPDTPMAAGSIGATGGSQPHDNHSPYLVLNYIIALQGFFPSQN
ncbi:MAG TPA: tail fiber protein [Candidatus Acidoferrum sp.]|nr:tail fiber protein [Candidatus Acidoferrum sp.]